MNSNTFFGAWSHLVRSYSQKRRRLRPFCAGSLLFLLSLSFSLGSHLLHSVSAQTTESDASANEQFITSFRLNLRQKDTSAAARTIERIGQMADRARAAAQSPTLVRIFAGDLADLVIAGPPSLPSQTSKEDRL